MLDSHQMLLLVRGWDLGTTIGDQMIKTKVEVEENSLYLHFAQ